MKLSIYIITTIGLLLSGTLKAQFPANIPPQGGNGFPNGSNQTGFPQRSLDDKKNKSSDGRIGLDDSTKIIYGPTSTKFFLEQDVFNNRKRLYNIDTTMDGIQNYNFVQRYKNTYQDLGNLGTAIRPVFYKAPDQIGTMLGYDAFSLYSFKPSQVRYYNTKSPFSNIIYVPGGNDQDLLQFELSRNIDSLWNIGINVQRISTNKQLIDRTVTRDNSATSHWDFMIHSNYQTKNKKYSILAYLNLSDHNSNDQGGVILEDLKDASGKFIRLNDYQEMLKLDNKRPLLSNATSRDNTFNFHVYHEYVGYKAFQFYQVIDYQSRKVQFIDKDFKTGIDNGFYPPNYRLLNVAPNKIYKNVYENALSTKFTSKLDTNYYALKPQTDSLYNETQYNLFEHKTGIKGFYKGFNYRLHIRQRLFSYQNPFNSFRNKGDIAKIDSSKNNFLFRSEIYKINKPKNTDTTQVYRELENFIGLWLNQYFKDSTRLFGEFEYLLGSDLRVNGEFQGKWLNIGGRLISSSPTLVHEARFDNGLRWENAYSELFDNVKTYNAFAYTTLKFKNFVLRPNIDINLVSGYIYFDQNTLVQQSETDILITRTGLDIDYKKGKFSTMNQIYLSSVSDITKIRIPPLFFNSRITYDLLYKKKLYIQAGVELHYKSAYFSDAYSPLIQQFHLQDKQPVEGYMQADVFANMRINRVRLFLKFSNVNQYISDGYYATPGFTAMGKTFNFGVHWLLFD